MLEIHCVKLAQAGSLDDLRRIGRQTERAVLDRAVAPHVEDPILVHGNKTIVFS